MECNKDEAIRAKEISEKKFEAMDYHGSKKFALKAQALYPSLDGIQHMLTTLDVYISSQDRINGETDWYKVLDVSPYADEDIIKKQYRKLALALHPDKNKSVGAEGAFKLISQAWNLLSDKSQRSVFDQIRNIKAVDPKVPTHGSNGVGTSNKSKTTSNAGVGKAKSDKTKSTTTAPPKNRQKYPSTLTFWTVCHRCKLQHEYLRMYLHQNLLCPGCNRAYYAFEYPPPSPQAPRMNIQPNLFQQNQAEYIPGFSGSCPSMNSQWNPFEKSKREREDVLNAMRKDQEADFKRRKGFEDPSGTQASSSESDKRGETKKTGTATADGKPNDAWSGYKNPNMM